MVALIALLTTSACGDTQNEEGEKGYESKTYEREIVFSAYETDTVLTIQEFAQVIEQKNRCTAGDSVPAKGLFLEEIEYPEEIFFEEEA